MNLLRVLPAVMAAVSMCVTARAGAGELWRTPWFSAASPVLETNPFTTGGDDAPRPVAFGTDGSVLLGAGLWLGADVQLVRLDAAGSLRWPVSLYDDYQSGTYGISSLQSAADGGAFVAFGSGIVRVDAHGAPLWRREIPVQWMAQRMDGAVAVSDCDSVTLLDAGNGNALWQTGAHGDSCVYGGIGSDSSGNVYALLALPDGSAGFRIARVGTDGHASWTRDVTDHYAYSLAGVGEGMLYVHADDDLLAVRTSDGSVAWTRPGVLRAVLGADHEPFAVGPDSLERLAASDGHAEWTLPIALAPASAAAIGNAVVGASASGLVRIDAATGRIAWTVPQNALPASAQDLFGAGGLAGGHFRAVYQPHDTATAPAVLEVDFASGAVSEAPLPPVAQALLATSAMDEQANVVSVGISGQPGQSMLAFRRTDGDDGAVMWETTEPIHDVGGVASLAPSLAQGAGRVVAALSANAADRYPFRVAATQVSLRDLATGDSLWSVDLRDDDQVYSEAPMVAVAPDGDVVLATGSIVRCADSGESDCARWSLFRLAGGDGSVRWRHDLDAYLGNFGIQAFPPQFKLAGDDVLLSYGAIHADEVQTLARLAGDTGATLWSAAPFAAGWGFVMSDFSDPHHLVLDAASTAGRKRAGIDVDHGSVAWTNAFPQEPYSACPGDTALTAQGDSLVAGSRNHVPLLRRYRNDGSGRVDEWAIGTPDAALDGCIERLQLEPSGNLRFLVVRHAFGTNNSAAFLARFDIATGTLDGEQAISGHGGDGSGDQAYSDPIGMPADDRLLVDSPLTVHAPSPTTDSVALLDTGITARGNLAVSLALDRADASPGETIGFHLSATYSGDQPIQSAHLAMDLPWQGGVTAIDCAMQSASHCVVDSRSGTVQAQFDVQPGGSVDIRGNAIVSPLDGDTPPVAAMTYGPAGLLEQRTDDNFARGVVTVQGHSGYASFHAPVPFDDVLSDAWRRLENAFSGADGAMR